MTTIKCNSRSVALRERDAFKEHYVDKDDNYSGRACQPNSLSVDNYGHTYGDSYLPFKSYFYIDTAMMWKESRKGSVTTALNAWIKVETTVTRTTTLWSVDSYFEHVTKVSDAVKLLI